MSRPPTKPQREKPSTVQLNMKISPELRKELRRRAFEADMPLNAWLPRFIETHLGSTVKTG